MSLQDIQPCHTFNPKINICIWLLLIWLFWESHSRLMELQSGHDEEMQRMGQIRRKAPAFWIEYKGSRLGEDELFSGRKSQLLIVGSACW